MIDPMPASSHKTTWQADATFPEKTAALRNIWAEVMDPEIALNIVQLGLIRDVEIFADGAHIKMILTTPFCPYGPSLVENARQKAEQVLEIPVTMEIGADMWGPSMMDDEAAANWGFL